jgi:hypothetical protein
MEKPFFSKSKEKFETSTISTWATLRKHLKALEDLGPRDLPKGTYNKLWHYKSYLLRTILELEKVPCLLCIEEEKSVNLDIPCNPVKYEVVCKQEKIITVGDFGSCSSSASSSSGEQ